MSREKKVAPMKLAAGSHPKKRQKWLLRLSLPSQRQKNGNLPPDPGSSRGAEKSRRTGPDRPGMNCRGYRGTCQ